MNKPQLYSMPCGCKLCSTSVAVADDKGKIDFKVWFEMCPMHQSAGRMRELLGLASARIEDNHNGRHRAKQVIDIFLMNLVEEEKKKAEKFSSS